VSKIWYWFRWIVLGVLTGGILLQSACATGLATGTAGLATSITNELIRNLVYKFMGVETFGFSFGT